MVTKMVPDTITNYPSHLDNGVRHDDIRCFETGNNSSFYPNNFKFYCFGFQNSFEIRQFKISYSEQWSSLRTSMRSWG